jgi:hypothetical protein
VSFASKWSGPHVALAVGRKWATSGQLIWIHLMVMVRRIRKVMIVFDINPSAQL